MLGARLDEHDDPRGILVIPDVCEPKAASYEALVRETSSAGVWAPSVGAEHVPDRYTSAPPNSHEAVVARMIVAMGRDAAVLLDTLAQVHLMTLVIDAGREASHDAFHAQMVAVASAMGAEFAHSYERSLRAKVEEGLRAEAVYATILQSTARLLPRTHAPATPDPRRNTRIAKKKRATGKKKPPRKQ
jgi:hypothetical protein